VGGSTTTTARRRKERKTSNRRGDISPAILIWEEKGSAHKVEFKKKELRVTRPGHLIKKKELKI